MEVILGKTAGFCYGVKRAVEGSIKQVENDENLYCLGKLVHNQQVISKLKEKGIRFIDDLEQVNNNSKVIIRAHGISKDIYEIAKNKGIDLIDFTCPNVIKVHNIAEEYSDKGFYVFITCSNKNHPEIIGTKSFCGKNYSLIEKIEDVEMALSDFEKSNKNRLLLISQTTYSMKKFNEIELKIKENVHKDIEFISKNTICLATKVRQDETEIIALEVDKMIIIGGKNSSNTQKLYEIAAKHCENSICIETKDDLKDEDFSKIKKVGIMAGASTPQEVIDEIVLSIKILNSRIEKGREIYVSK